jgi:hypothetical protein
MALRRRNPKGGRHFAGAGPILEIAQLLFASGRRRLQSGGRDARIHFSAAC